MCTFVPEMKQSLNVESVNDYARYVGAEELHPLVSIIHYDELEHCRQVCSCCRKALTPLHTGRVTIATVLVRCSAWLQGRREV